MRQKYHMCINIRGLLKNKDRDLAGLFTDDNGKPMAAAQIRSELSVHLSKGHEVIPCGKCDNFDWKHGCQGHILYDYEEVTTA